jgi:hypothetical protein
MFEVCSLKDDMLSESPETIATVLSSLQILQQHVIDSYYQVIIRKYNGVETLQTVLNVFSLSDQTIVALCKSILNYLESSKDYNND